MKVVSIAFLFFTHFLSFAQWQTPNNTNTVSLNNQNSTRNVGIGTTNAAAKLHVVGNTWLNGITSITGLVYQGNTITFTGAKLDFFTPVQAQYNGGKPILSLSQFGEINFFSSPYLNQNTIYLGWSGDFNHGIRQSNNFGGASGFDGPVVFGQNGAALGSSTQNQNWTNNGTKVALSWNNDNVVKIHNSLQFADGTLQTTAGQNVTYNSANNYYTYQGNVNIPGLLKVGNNSLYLGGVSNGTPGTSNEIYTDGSALEIQSKTASIYNQNTIINNGNTGRVGIGTTALTEKLNIDGNVKFATANTGVVFNDGSSLKTSTDLYRTGSANVYFQDKILIGGDNPALRLGSMVIQDFTKTSYGPSVFGSNYPNITSSPSSFVFGNIIFDEVSQKYKSIYNGDDTWTLNYSRPGGGTIVANGQNSETKNGGTAMRFNSNDGSIEFITIPTVGGVANGMPSGLNVTVTGFALTEAELLQRRQMVITGEGKIGIGTAYPTEKLEVNGTASFKNTRASNLVIGNGDESDFIYENALPFEEGAGNVLIKGNAEVIGNLNLTRNLGVGTLNPNEKLEVNGNVKATGLIIPTNAATGKILMSDFTGRASWEVINQSQWVSNANDISFTLGKVNIGRSPNSSDHKLSVDGKIIATELNLSLGYWPDDVFNANYKLKSLKEIDTFIQKNKHLPQVPSANEMTKNGVNTAKMLQIQMKKIEELTLYLIQQNKEIELLKSKSTSK